MPLAWGDGSWGPGLWGSSDNPFEFDEITLYYINLLIMQYVTKERARNTVGVFVRELVNGSLISQVRDGFDLDTAIGVQLDKVAAYRGLVRTVYGIDLTREYFSVAFYDDSTPFDGVGFAFYDEDAPGYSFFYSDTNRPVYSMTDSELRRIVKLVAKTQSRFLSVKEIDEILWAEFGDNLYLVDNENMTIEYVHDPTDTDNLFKIAEGVGALPKPAGVSMTVV
jgi:hypothetical protein